MTVYQIAEAKAHFSSLIKEVEQGNVVMIARGRNNRAIAVLVPASTWKKQAERKLGTLAHWGEVALGEDWHISDEELLGR
ncbi:MAG: type II toxin-antitoxin system Phd/YefM family antitoxin [Coriobacteriaceae bacterium]|nr:type II toxin-antitoxin system Phd/YefM family antitoxin [Coriobacteriaceae bacterium]